MSGPSSTTIIVPGGVSATVSSGTSVSSAYVLNGGTLTDNGTIGVAQLLATSSSTVLALGAGGSVETVITSSASATVTINAGGSAAAADIVNGSLSILSGGVVSSLSGCSALIHLSSGGVLDNAVLSGGSFSMDGGSVGQVTLADGALAYAFGGTISSLRLTGDNTSFGDTGSVQIDHLFMNGGTFFLPAGATLEGAHIDGGVLDITGGTADGTVIGSGAQEVISAGPYPSGTTPVAFGDTNFTIASGGVQTIMTVVTMASIDPVGIVEASSGTIEAGGSEIIQSGGIVSSITVSGQQYIGSAASALDDRIAQGGVVIDDGVLALDPTAPVYGTISGSGVILVASGQMADLTSNPAGLAGFAGTYVVDGGTLTLSSGELARAAVAYGSGTGGNLVVAGDVSPALVLKNFAPGDELTLSGVSYASGISAQLVSGHVLQVTNGGTVLASIGLDPSGHYGASTFTVSGGVGGDVAVGVASGSTAPYFADTVIGSGVTSFSLAETNASVYVAQGGTLAQSTIGNGATLMLQGAGIDNTLSGPLISGGTGPAGSETILSGGVATNDTIIAGAQQTLLDGASAVSTMVSGGTQILSGGTAVGTVVEGFNTESFAVYAVSIGRQIVTGPGVASGTVVSGVIGTSFPAYASFSPVGDDAIQEVSSGGQVFDTTLIGSSYLHSFGLGRNNVVSAVANQYVDNGGIAYNDTIGAYASATIAAGGIISGAVVSGIYESNEPYAFGYPPQTPYDNLHNTGREIVLSGGAALGVDIQLHGEVDVASGGTVSGVLLDGGVLVLSSGAILEGAIDVRSGVVELPDFAYGSGVSGSISPAGLLTVSGPDGQRTIQFAMPAESTHGEREEAPTSAFGTPIYFMQAPTGGGTDIVYGTMCYGLGTHILTPGGERRVETLAIGDQILTHGGLTRPIHWIGRRAYDPVFARGNRDVLPVLVRAGALGDRLPHRDLILSPLHALYLDGVLVPVLHLVDGRDIVQIERPDSIHYFHIELETHDLLVAEGVPAESFLDEGDRGGFHNAHEFATLYPDFERPAPVYCAPRIEDGPVLEGIRARLAMRGDLVARIDVIDACRIEGWAFLPGRNAPLVLEIFDGDRALGVCVADRARPDVLASMPEALGERVGFSLGLPRGHGPVDPDRLRLVPVRLAAAA